MLYAIAVGILIYMGIKYVMSGANEKAELKGLVAGAGIGDANDAINHKEVMKKAYELGKNL